MNQDQGRARLGAATIRRPRPEDGSAVWQLIAGTASLDDNSMYCNLLQCSHFAATCALAEADGQVIGWVSGYIPPETPDTYFVWQVCVAEAARGRGLARQLVDAVLARPACAPVCKLQSTITDDNAASWALFDSIARSRESGLARQPHFDSDAHFGGRHATEHLVTIGPFARSAASLDTAA